MVGIVIAFIVFLVSFIFKTSSAAFIIATTFLFGWYVFWVVAVSFILLFFAILFVTFGALYLNNLMRSRLFAVIGGLIGGGFTLVIFSRFFIIRTLRLAGVYMMMTSGTTSMMFSEFNSVQLALGAVLFLVTFLINGKRVERLVNKNIHKLNHLKLKLKTTKF